MWDVGTQRLEKKKGEQDQEKKGKEEKKWKKDFNLRKILDNQVGWDIFG